MARSSCSLPLAQQQAVRRGEDKCSPAKTRAPCYFCGVHPRGRCGHRKVTSLICYTRMTHFRLTPTFALPVASVMPWCARSIFMATLLASSLIGCGGRASDTCDSCDAIPRPGPLDLSSTDAAALMRAKVPPSAKLVYLDSDPHEYLALDGTSRSWFSTFEDEGTQQAWFGRISTLSGVATVSLEPGSYVDCPGPGATDLPSSELVPDAVRRFSAAGLPDALISLGLSYSEAAPCVVATVADTVGALLTGHYVLANVQSEGQGQSFHKWSYYDDQGQFHALCGPCETGLPGNCMSCTR